MNLGVVDLTELQDNSATAKIEDRGYGSIKLQDLLPLVTEQSKDSARKEIYTLGSSVGSRKATPVRHSYNVTPLSNAFEVEKMLGTQ